MIGFWNSSGALLLLIVAGKFPSLNFSSFFGYNNRVADEKSKYCA